VLRAVKPVLISSSFSYIQSRFLTRLAFVASFSLLYPAASPFQSNRGNRFAGIARAGRDSQKTALGLLLSIQALTSLYTRSILGASPLESLLKAGKERVKTGAKTELPATRYPLVT
jgi:hypothetical protein